MNYFSEKDILFEDESILVIHKAAGIAVQHARTGQMDLEHGVLNYLARKRSAGASGRQMPYLAVIHRLDQPVEGVIVFAKNQQAAANLNRQLTSDKMEKKYLAVVDVTDLAAFKGKKAEQELTDYLYKDGKNNISKVVTKDTSGGKKALLYYQVLKMDEEKKRAKLSITLKTGRHHQIRVQLSHAGLPLCGDQKYNPHVQKGESLALCAAALSFTHPDSGRLMHFETVPQNQLFDIF